MSNKEVIKSGLINIAIGLVSLLITFVICKMLDLDLGTRLMLYSFAVTSFALSVPKLKRQPESDSGTLIPDETEQPDILIWLAQPFDEYKIRNYLWRKALIIILMLLPLMIIEVSGFIKKIKDSENKTYVEPKAPANDMDFANHPELINKAINETRAKADTARYFAIQMNLRKAEELSSQKKYREAIAFCKTIPNSSQDTSVNIFIGDNFKYIKQLDSARYYWAIAKKYGAKKCE
ncbi:MAG: hypothetical protein WCM76_15995 [Bacteroidota bacterium]